MSKHTFYSGIIRHRRFEPTTHEFKYKLFMLCINLDHLDSLFNRWPLASMKKPALGWFKRGDYMGSKTIPIKKYVLDQVEHELGFRPQGKVTLLTHLRMWGVLMNPIAVFNCHHPDGSLAAVALQVTNTPWNERYLYVMKASNGHYKQHFEFEKFMHVSPFNPMDMRYSCHYMQHEGRLVLHLENHKNGKSVTDATLTMTGQPLTRKKLYQSILVHPYMTAKVYYGIYRQALALFLKKSPLYTNPTTDSGTPERQSRGHL